MPRRRPDPPPDTRSSEHLRLALDILASEIEGAPRPPQRSAPRGRGETPDAAGRDPPEDD